MLNIGKNYQAKLVSCVRGAILDVVVDVRKESKTFGKWVSVELSEYNNHQLWIPKGFAHGYRTLEDNTEVMYKADEFYDPDDYKGFIWNDKNIGIDWGVSVEDELILSDQDAAYGNFNA
jgi:dTDP-4-dehydrorhamnose 3,5-epimerase